LLIACQPPPTQATMPHINDTDTTRSGAQMDSPANTPYRRTNSNSNTAAASMAFMLRTAVFLFDGYGCGRGCLKTGGEDW
ncbi:hypothetical protein, partial [Neisseria sp. oral taxon 020]|uniref:hypothetical protein n=1 Tax=Neisseria sp. oral taxon 020 TaxID=712401 RepID=UPI001E5A1040